MRNCISFQFKIMQQPRKALPASLIQVFLLSPLTSFSLAKCTEASRHKVKMPPSHVRRNRAGKSKRNALLKRNQVCCYPVVTKHFLKSWQSTKSVVGLSYSWVTDLVINEKGLRKISFKNIVAEKSSCDLEKLCGKYIIIGKKKTIHGFQRSLSQNNFIYIF